MNEALAKIVQEWGSPRVLLIGDAMLDRYVRGSVERISPEAPIPVMRQSSEESRPGGAGAVALNLAAFGAKPVFACLLGDDIEGKALGELLRNTLCEGFLAAVTDENRATTVKTRFLGNVQAAGRGIQHIMRLDREDSAALDEKTSSEFVSTAAKKVPSSKAVLLSDYGKGAIHREVVEACVNTAKNAGVPVIADPHLSTPVEIYKDVTGMVPNRYEAARFSGVDSSTARGCLEAAKTLTKRLSMDWCAVTADRDGVYLYSRETGEKHLPTTPRAVYDVTGAGDMVLATIGMALASGGALETACMLANVTAGVEVGKIGVATVSKEEIRSALLKPDESDKIKTADELTAALEEHRRRGEKIVFTNGCYDILHVGHISILGFAKKQGDVLVVGLNTDRSVRALKGEGRPVNPEGLRARVVAALADVDYAVLFDEDTPKEIIERVRPDVLVKGEDWKDKGVVGREFVESFGGRVALAPLVKDLSTTGTIEKIRKNK